MKLNQIFIALFSAFLLTSPQIVMTSEIEDLESSVTQDLEGLGAKEDGFSEMSEEKAEEIASKMSKLEEANPEVYEKLMNEYEDKLKKSSAYTEKFAAKDEELLKSTKGQEDTLDNKIKDKLDRVKGRNPKLVQKMKIDDLVEEMKSFKSIENIQTKELRTAAKDLSEIDPARAENSNLTASDMKKKVNKWIDNSDLPADEKARLKSELNEAKFTDKKDIFNKAKEIKEDLVNRKIDRAFDKEIDLGSNGPKVAKKDGSITTMKDSCKEANKSFFDSIESGEKSPFSTADTESFDRLTNDNLNESMKESRVVRKEYFEKNLDDLGIRKGGEFDTFMSTERSLLKGTDELKALSTEGEEYGVTRAAKDKFENFKRKVTDVKAIGKSIFGAVGHVVETLFSAVLFMIPNLIQSAITGGMQKKAEVLKWAQPIEFGGKVYQIPDECLAVGSVNVLSQGASSYLTGSVPVYVQIPVTSVGEAISSDVAKMFDNKISGPTPDSTYYGANRYQIDPDFYNMTDIVVSYGGVGSMTPTGGTIINSSEFGGQVISLKTGLVTDASGEIFNATELPLADGISQSPAVPLIPVIAWGNITIPQTSPINEGLQSSFEIQPTILEKLELMGALPSKTLMNQFDTSCLKANGGLNDLSCSCMLVEGLEALASGLDLKEDGTVSFAEIKLGSDDVSIIGANVGALTQLKKGTSSVSSTAVTVAAPTASQKKLKLGRLSNQKKFKLGRLSNSTTSDWSGLGAVIPVFGWGTDAKTNQAATIIPTGSMSLFDGFKKYLGSLTPSQSSLFSLRGYADDDAVWAAQGCWIYLCTNTPFIKELQKLYPGLTSSVVGSITDYIVFMDEDLNIIPLMVPENIKEKNSADTDIWTKATFTVNPVIRYWTSLIFYNNDFMVQAISGQNQSPILFEMSDTKAAAYVEPILGVMESQITQQNPNNGKIEIFLNNAGQQAQQPPYPISQSFADIYNQIVLHKEALRFKIGMLFTINSNRVALKPSTYSIKTQDTKGNSATIQLYSGVKCFGSANIDDLLLPLDGNPIAGSGNPLSLPNSGVQCFASLITDIVYQVDMKTGNYSAFSSVAIPAQSGTPASTSTGFAQSPLNLDSNNKPIKNGASYEVNQQYATTLSNLSVFIGASDTLTTESTAKKYTANKDLIAYVQSKRTAWLETVVNVVELGTGENTIVCNLAGNIPSLYAQNNNCYIYELNQSPSIVYTTSDYFVVVDGNNPTLDSLSSLKQLSSQSASMVLVSLISGTLYKVEDGSAINDVNGNPVRIKISGAKYVSKNTIKTTADIIYETITTKFKGLPQGFKTTYKQIVDSYDTTQAIPQGPYAFGKYKVAIRSIDASMGNYIYFNAADMTKVHIRPKDMYVILTKSANGYQPDEYDKKKSQILLSLITGVAVDQNGTLIGKQPQANLDSIIAGYNSIPFIAQSIKKLQSDYQAKQAALKADVEKQDQALKDAAKNQDPINKLDIAAATVIKRLQPAGNGLAAPFVSLQQDPTTGNYVRISPTATSGELIYQFMDTGKVYDYSGRFVMQLLPGHLESIRDQLGVVVDDKSGKQKLGIPQFQPSLRLTNKDASVVVGKSGDNMVAVGSADYPGKGIIMAEGNGLFYNRNMDTYYVLDGKQNLWMSVDAGHVYQKDGQSVVDDKKVAIFIATKSGKVYPLLVETNSAGYVQGFLSDGAEYSNLSSSNQNMTWLGMSGDFNQYTVTTDATTSQATPSAYKVSYGKNNSRTFTVNADYSWQQLALVPIENNGKLLQNVPGSSYQLMQLVQKGTDIKFVIYNGSLYHVGKASKGTSTLTPFNTNDVNAVSGLKFTAGFIDKNTQASYVEIIDGANIYKYGYMPKVFDSAQQEANRENIIKGVTAATPVAIPVGPMKEVSAKSVDSTITISQPTTSTNVMFAADLPMKGTKVDITKATLQDVVNPVTAQSTSYDTFVFDLQVSGSALGNGVMKTSDGRFVYKIAAQTYTYLLEDSYVDLQNGAIYDASSGMALGICLTIDDLTSVLDECGVCANNKTVAFKDAEGKEVVTNPNGDIMLEYRGVVKKTAVQSVPAQVNK